MSEQDFSDVLADANRHVEDRVAAAEEAEEQARPRSSGRVLVALSVLLAAVVAWNGFSLTRPPDVPTAAEQAVDLAWIVVGTVDLIEAYRSDDGRLPEPSELADVIDEEVTYTPRTDGYVVRAETEAATVEYDSDVAIDAWMSTQGLVAEGGS